MLVSHCTVPSDLTLTTADGTVMLLETGVTWHTLAAHGISLHMYIILLFHTFKLFLLSNIATWNSNRTSNSVYIIVNGVNYRLLLAELQWKPLKQLDGCFTLLCSTTTLRGSPLSHVSMALHMLQILSSAGAWRSGQPNSRTWGTCCQEKKGKGLIKWMEKVCSGLNMK